MQTTNVVCAACDAVIRVPTERLAEGPRCPRCHVPLFAGQPLELRAASFERHLTRNDLPLVVDFWAPWCGPCRMMAPHFTAAAQRMEPRVRFAKVNSDEENVLANRYGIRSIPTVIAFKAGREIARQAGAMDTGTLTRWVETAIGR